MTAITKIRYSDADLLHTAIITAAVGKEGYDAELQALFKTRLPALQDKTLVSKIEQALLSSQDHLDRAREIFRVAISNIPEFRKSSLYDAMVVSRMVDLALSGKKDYVTDILKLFESNNGLFKDLRFTNTVAQIFIDLDDPLEQAQEILNLFKKHLPEFKELAIIMEYRINNCIKQRDVSPIDTPNVDVVSLPPPRERLIDTITKMFNEGHADRVYWLPHPEHEREDGELFPQSKVSVEKSVNGGIYTWRNLYALFGDKYPDYTQSGNELFRWLNKELGQTEDCALDDFFSSTKPVFMNCSDFVYLNLYLSKILSKEEILVTYKLSRCRELLKEKTHYLGFNLSRFKPYDMDTTKEARTCDILIAFNDKNEPQHVLFLNGHDQGIGLWSLDGVPKIGPSASCVPLKLMQESYLNAEKSGLNFRYCPLMEAIEP